MQIRRNYRIRGLTADECLWEHCGRGLTRIIIPQHEMDATHEPIAAWTTRRGPVTWRRVSNHSTAALTLTPRPTMLGAGCEWYGASGHHQLQQHTAGAGQHPTTLRRPGTGEVDNVRQWHVGKQTNRVQTIRHAARHRRCKPPAAWLGPGIVTAMQKSEHGLDSEAAGQRPKCSLCVCVSLCVECGRYTERLRTDNGSQITTDCGRGRGRGSLVAVCGQTRTENYRIRTPLVHSAVASVTLKLPNRAQSVAELTARQQNW